MQPGPAPQSQQAVLSPESKAEEAMETAAGPSYTLPAKTRACVTCTRRKIKCDKATPQCAACAKSNIACQYEPPSQSRAKRKAVSDIHTRLDKYERLLERHGLLSDSAPEKKEVETVVNPFLQPQRVLEPKPVLEPNQPERHQEGPQNEFTESDMFTRIREAANSAPQDGLAGLNAKAEQSMHLSSDAALASAALFGTGPLPFPSLANYHPPYEVAMKLWKVYKKNVDPVIKFLHVPTMEKMLEQVAANPSMVPDKETECLVFAIYMVTANSMNDSDTREVFGELGDAWSRYHDALRIALISCQYFKTSNLKVLQAFVLLLMSIRSRSDPDTLWTLTGNAMRIAQRMRLHRDGTQLGLSPYETEMRRRLWWIIIPLDAGSGRLSGVGGGPVLPTFWDTKRPLNINDDDIFPEIATTPEPRVIATDMMFCLVKMEIGGFHQRIRHKIGGWFRETDSAGLLHFEQALETLKETIEEKYIRYCDITLPIHYFTVAMARAALDYGELQLRLQQDKSTMTPVQRKAVFALAIRILDHDIACTLNPAISRFAWFRADFLQWGPLIWLLNELSHSNRDAAEAEGAWEKIEQVYNCHPELLRCTRSIDIALGNLTLAAWDASRYLLPQKPEPSYVSSLRAAFAPKKEPDASTDLGQQPFIFDSNDFTAMLQQHDPLNALHIDNNWSFWEQILQNSTTSSLNF